MRALQLIEDRRLELTDLAPPPPPGPGEVTVRIKVVALNHIDVWGWPPRDAEHPGADLRRVAQPRDPPQHADPRVLHDLTRRLVVSREPRQIGRQRCVPALDERVEGRALAELAAHRDELVGGRALRARGLGPEGHDRYYE